MFFTAVAQEVVDRALLIQETSDAIGSQGERQGIIIVGGYVSRFADEFSGNGFRVKWPFPWPPPPWWAEEVSGTDLIVAGVQFEQAAANTFNETARQTLADAGAQLISTGVERLQ